jgi:hypothetical protein
MVQLPKNHALVTIAIHITDLNATVHIGGPPEAAEAAAMRLAAEFGVPVPAENELLKLTLTNKEVITRLYPIVQQFPGIGFTTPEFRGKHQMTREQIEAEDNSPDGALHRWPVIMSPRLREVCPPDSRELVTLMDGLLPFLQTLRIGKEPQLVDWETPIGTIRVGVFLPYKINVWFADELAAEEVAVREARPADVLDVELGVNDGGKVVGEINPASTDWAWLSGVVREAFDPLAVNGPTYKPRRTITACFAGRIRAT